MTYYRINPDDNTYTGEWREASFAPYPETQLVPPFPEGDLVPIWDGSAWVMMVPPAVVAARIEAAWRAADAFANGWMDPNSRHTIDMLLSRNTLEPLPLWQLGRILQYGAWWESLWRHYGEVRTRIAAGQDARFNPAVPGDCPWTIWQISALEP